MKNILLWIIAFPIAIIFSSLISFAYSYFISIFLSEPALFNIFGTYIQYFIQGISFVMIVYFVVPNHKLKAIFTSCFIFISMILISEFYLKNINSEPREIPKMCISIFGALLGTFNMYIMHVSDKNREK